MEQSYAEWKAEIASNQDKLAAERRKEMKRQCRLAYDTGGTVPYCLAELIELKLSLKVIRAINRG